VTSHPVRFTLVQVSGDKIKAARERAGLTRPELASKTGIPVDTIKTIETRPHNPGADKIAVIAKALDVPMESLFDRNGDTA
jgi:transcriptional regulator with XRE-family HTH domain